MPNAQQLANRASEERATAAELIELLNKCRGIVKRWETGGYGDGLTNQNLIDAGIDSSITATEVQNGINAFAAFVALSDNTWGNVLENIYA